MHVRLAGPSTAEPAPASRQPDTVNWTDGNGAAGPLGNPQTAPINAVSRRKQQQLEQATQQQHDKYAVETELDLDSLQQIGDSEQVDLSRQARTSLPLHQRLSGSTCAMLPGQVVFCTMLPPWLADQSHQRQHGRTQRSSSVTCRWLTRPRCTRCST